MQNTGSDFLHLKLKYKETGTPPATLRTLRPYGTEAV